MVAVGRLVVDHLHLGEDLDRKGASQRQHAVVALAREYEVEDGGLHTLLVCDGDEW